MRFAFKTPSGGPNPLYTLQDQIHRLLHQFQEGFTPDGTPDTLGHWAPVLDMAETDEAFLVLADLPGLAAEDIKIGIADGVLTLEGTRKPYADGAVRSVHTTERPHGQFSRSVRLPGVVDVELVSAEAKQGVLTITLPKKIEARPRQVAVKVK